MGGCGGVYGTPGMQAGGFKFKDIVNGVKKGVAWAKKNKPLEKALKFADDVVPDALKGNPIYSKIRETAGQVSKQLGIGPIKGQSSQIMGPITYNRGMVKPITGRTVRRRMVGGSKRAPRKQKGTGKRKKRSKKVK